ncbi:MAG: alpha,alpha-trehalase TreF [Candidatus Microsaccharimonas sp.]
MARKINSEKLKSSLVATTGTLLKSKKGFDEHLGELLLDVQKNNVYGDGKTFVDLVPAKRLKSIKEEYEFVRKDPDFNLQDFVTKHFYDATDGVYAREYKSNPKHTPVQHIGHLWKFLERKNRITRGSLLALPNKYIVPGGRFNEQFYWDTYFIMIGLSTEDKWTEIELMMKNYAFMIRKYGYIPTANRSYLLSRSQPPFFSQMVRLLERKKGRKVLREYLPLLVAEYRFWMKGRTKLASTEFKSWRRVVRMPDGSLLNRYYDNKSTPRPESLKEDIETAETSGRKDSEGLYLHIRAAAESGWDFSSRWFLDPQDIRTIHTADIIPVDLNSLLYHLELTIADAYTSVFNLVKARQYRKKAKERKVAMEKYLWNEDQGFFRDYNFHQGYHTPVESLAAVFPLFVGLAEKHQAERVATRLESLYLMQGGLLTTLIDNGQQWDAPNGWAPLQWVAIKGLERYGHNELADEIASRWVSLNERVYAKSHKFVEKYNVTTEDGLGGGGEYVLQDGFGWTNGVYEALKKGYKHK